MQRNKTPSSVSLLPAAFRANIFARLYIGSHLLSRVPPELIRVELCAVEERLDDVFLRRRKIYEKEERSATSVNHHILDDEDDECKIRNQGRASAPYASLERNCKRE